MPSSSSSRISAVRPLWAVEGGLVTIAGTASRSIRSLPSRVHRRRCPARLATASPHELTAIVPAGLDGGRTPVRIDEALGETAFVEIGAPLATGLHQVDSPAFDADGNLYVTFSGSRGQQAPVSIFIVRPDGSREPFVSDLPNPTSLAFDADGRLHVSSRFDGSVHRVDAGRTRHDGGDRSRRRVRHRVSAGRHALRRRPIRIDPARARRDARRSSRASRRASPRFISPSAPTAGLYVTAPTLDARDCVYRVSPDGRGRGVLRRLRPPAGAGVRRDRAICTSSTRSRARAASTACVSIGRSEMEQVVAGGSLWGSRSTRAAGSSLASSDTVLQAVGPRSRARGRKA